MIGMRALCFVHTGRVNFVEKTLREEEDSHEVGRKGSAAFFNSSGRLQTIY